MGDMVPQLTAGGAEPGRRGVASEPAAPRNEGARGARRDQTEPVNRPDALDAARALIADRFPDARQAWLSGSVVLGGATETSDLDITVLLDATEVHRESVSYEGWPVELFVHTESSIRHFVAKDLARRRPTMARLVSTGVPLLGGDGGASLR